MLKAMNFMMILKKNINIPKNWIIPGILVFLLPVVIFAQDVPQLEEITVEAAYKPQVSDAFKINVTPRIPEGQLTKPEFTYKLLAKEPNTQPELEPIVPAKIEGESVSKLYQNYIRAGLGNYATPYLEFYANQLRSKKSAFGVHLKHISSSGNIKDYAYPGNSNTELKIHGKRFVGDHTVSADAHFQRRGIHYYGYHPDDFPGLDLEKKEIKQHFNEAGAEVRWQSNYSSDNKLDHYIGASYDLLADRFDSKEQNIKADLGLSKKTSFFSFSEIEKLGIDGGVDYYINKDTLQSYNSGIIGFTPFYSLGFDQYFFKVGIKTNIQSDSSSSVHVYPVIRIEVKVVEDYLITYAGITGDLERNSLSNFSHENPFVISTVEKRFTNNKISQYGGIKGRITKFLDYNLSFVNSTLNNAAFFVNDTASAIAPGLNNQFAVIYDDVKYTRILAEFGFHYRDKVNFMLRGQYNNYFLDNEDEAWHKPALEISFGADYNFQEKIKINAAIISRSKMFAKTYEQLMVNGNPEWVVKAEKMDGMMDVNLGAEYQYTKQLSGFIQLNNLLGQRYFRWYNYPSYRFNMMLGVAYSF